MENLPAHALGEGNMVWQIAPAKRVGRLPKETMCLTCMRTPNHSYEHKRMGRITEGPEEHEECRVSWIDDSEDNAASWRIFESLEETCR